MELDFEVLFSPMITAMKMNSSYPYLNRDWKWVIKVAVLQGLYEVMLSFFVLDMVVYAYPESDWPTLCGDVCLCLINLIISFKCLISIKHRDHFRILIDLAKADYEHAKKLPVEEMNIVLEYARQGKIVTIWWCRLVIWGSLLCPFRATCFTIYSHVYKRDYHIHDLYPIHLPFIDNTSVPRFFLVNIVVAYGVFYAAIVYNAFVPIGPALMLHANGQLAVLEYRLQTIFPDHGFSPQDTNKKLRDIAHRLREIYR